MSRKKVKSKKIRTRRKRKRKKKKKKKLRCFFSAFFFFLRYRPCALRNISLKDESKLKTGRSGEKDGDRSRERDGRGEGG